MGIILVRIQSKCGGNADQNNDEYGHFLCSVVGIFHWFISSFWLIFINFSNINLLILPSSLLAGLINQILGWLLKFGYQKKTRILAYFTQQITAQRWKLSTKDFFSKYDQIRGNRGTFYAVSNWLVQTNKK